MLNLTKEDFELADRVLYDRILSLSLNRAKILEEIKRIEHMREVLRSEIKGAVDTMRAEDKIPEGEGYCEFMVDDAEMKLIELACKLRKQDTIKRVTEENETSWKE